VLGFSRAVVTWNAAGILGCVQVWSDFSYSQYTNQYYYPPLSFVSMHSYCFPNLNAFCKFCCLLACAVLFRLFVNYLDYRVVYVC